MNQSLSSDQFLYFCKQALVARTTKSTSKYGLKHESRTEFDSHLRYEPFLYKTYKIPKALTVSAFRRELGLVCQHAFEASPQFRRNEPIDLETISYFSAAIATLVADFETLFFEYTSLQLPAILGVPVPKSDTEKLPHLGKLFMKYEVFLKANQALLPDAERPEFIAYPLEASKGSAEEQDESASAAAPKKTETETEAELVAKDKVLVSQEFWGTALNLIRKVFTNHHQSIVSFLNWHFQPEIEPEKIDWRLRPPVGEAFQQFVRSLQSQSRAGAQYGSGSGGAPAVSFGSHSGQRYAQKNPAQGKSERPPKRKDLDETFETNKPAFSEAEGKRPEKRKDHHSQHNLAAKQADVLPDRKPDQKPAQETDAAALDAAIQEVEHSARILQKNSRRPGLKLKPQNSFIRRHQHMAAKELGYETESVGEGKERCVYLKNKSADN